MGFIVDEAIDHMGACALKFARLLNIGGLVKAGFQLHKGRNRLAVFRRFAQSRHNWAFI